MPQIIKSTPCKNCGNESYTVPGPKIEGGKVTIQNPVCTKCGTPLDYAGNHPVPIVNPK